MWSPELWPENEVLNRVKFYRKAVVISLRWSSPHWRQEHTIILIKSDFFMGWSSIVFKLDEKWWDFDRLRSTCGHWLKTWRLTEFSRENIRFWSKFGSQFSWTHSTGGTGGIKIGLTLKIDMLTHREGMDEPFWGLTKLITKIRFCFKKWPFVTPPVVFYVNFRKKRNFNDLDKVLMNFLNWVSSNGPEWWIDSQRCLKRGLGSSRSKFASKMV